MSDLKAKMLRCTKFDSVGAPPQTPLGEITVLPRPHLMGRVEKGGRER